MSFIIVEINYQNAMDRIDKKEVLEIMDYFPSLNSKEIIDFVHNSLPGDVIVANYLESKYDFFVLNVN